MENKQAIKDTISDLIMDAAISKAIEEKRDLLRPSIEHFLSGKNVNGEFDIALKKLMRWVENKTIEAVQSHYASQNEELIKENEELKEHIGETKSLNNSYAEKIKRQNERIKLLEEEIDGEEAVSRDRAAAISQLQSTIDELKEKLKIYETNPR